MSSYIEVKSRLGQNDEIYMVYFYVIFFYRLWTSKLTNITLGVLQGDNLPQAIGNRVKLNTDTGHTISATKEIEKEIRKYYEK